MPTPTLGHAVAISSIDLQVDLVGLRAAAVLLRERQAQQARATQQPVRRLRERARSSSSATCGASSLVARSRVEREQLLGLLGGQQAVDGGGHARDPRSSRFRGDGARTDRVGCRHADPRRPRPAALTPDDFEASLALGVEAFGALPAGTPAPAPAHRAPAGPARLGHLRRRRPPRRPVVGREFASWFGGVEVPTCGVAGVAVAAERRGDGLLADLVRAHARRGAGRGEVISTLYPTAPGIYRRLGYELVGSLDRVELPTSELLGVRRRRRA